MNLLLATPDEIGPDNRLVVRGRRLRHLQEVLRAKVGDRLRVGVLQGLTGLGTLESITPDAATLRLVLEDAPPPALPLTVVLALPRPKMLRRILRSLAELGVKQIHLINSYRVEKSFWQSPLLGDEVLQEALISGLEQARDTILPTVAQHRRFRPFVEDLLPPLCADRTALLGDPHATQAYPSQPPTPALLILGPEGGFIPFEVDLLKKAGALPVHLGPRILRVETALSVCLGRHLPVS